MTKHRSTRSLLPDASSEVTVESVVWSDPERLGGVPCFRGTRVPVATLFDYLEGGDSLPDFLEDFPGVTRAQALGALALGKERLLEVPSSRS